MKGLNDIVKGTRLFSVLRWGDGKLHVSVIKISDIKVTYTPTGRPRQPVYIAHGDNFTRNGQEDFEIDPSWYHSTATSAVCSSIQSYIGMITSRSSCMDPKQRLLKSIFGENPNPTVAATEIVDVIHELKNYHSLFAEAFRIDDEVVQKIDVEDGEKEE